jgi:hypothetical protein
MLVDPHELLQNQPVRDGRDVMQKGSCQRANEALRVAASSNRLVNTDVLAAAFARLWPVGHLRRYASEGN